MRIGIVGNCQSRGLIDSLEVLAPDHLFEAIQLEQVQDSEDPALLAVTALASEVDAMFVHLPEYALSGSGPQEALRNLLSQVRSVIAIPSVIFGGFHPDFSVLRCNGRYLETVASHYHSAIVAGAYLCGLPASRVPALFNRFVYAGLGYADDFVHHGRSLLESFSQLGFDGRYIFPAKRTFMHCPNHPVVDILFELAKQMLERVNIKPQPGAQAPEDWLGKYSFLLPSYPGLPGSAPGEYDPANPAASLQIVHGERVIRWDEFIDSSYACYTAHQLETTDWHAPAIERAARFLSEHVRP